MVTHEGTLQYNYEENRYGILDNDGWYISGLHCGMCFDVYYKGRWFPTRIELAEDWFLVGIPSGVEMRGLTVRV